MHFGDGIMGFDSPLIDLSNASLTIAVRHICWEIYIFFFTEDILTVYVMTVFVLRKLPFPPPLPSIVTLSQLFIIVKQLSGCFKCNVVLCKTGDCWKLYHSNYIGKNESMDLKDWDFKDK